MRHFIVAFFTIFILMPKCMHDFGVMTFKRDGLPVQAHVMLENHSVDKMWVESSDAEVRRIFHSVWDTCVDMDSCDPYREKGFSVPDINNPEVRYLFIFQRDSI